MTTTVQAFGEWKTNAAMIADVAKLGYLDGRVMDPTWGVGNFWTVFKPSKLVRHDLYTLDGVDATGFGTNTVAHKHRRESFDSIVLDFPYAFRGAASEDFDEKYGVDEYMSANDIMARIFDGMTCCTNLLRQHGYLLVKCQDQVVSGNVRWQTDEVTAHARKLGLRKVDRFDLAEGGRPQPERTKRCPHCAGTGAPQVRGLYCPTCGGSGRIPSTQQHAGYRPSTLLVFRKPKQRGVQLGPK